MSDNVVISLTTDFGTQDGYVGVMKGVMAGIAPGVPFIDISHEIPPQDVRSAAYVLWTMIPYFPEGSVHLVVVDPGVGMSRRPIAAKTPWGLLVGPDNGVFSYVWHAAQPELIVELAASEYQLGALSATFHGRDIFAPAAAHLACGLPLRKLGGEVKDPVRLPLPLLDITDGALHGEVIYIDHFGNVITSIGRLVWEGDYLHLDAAFGAAQPLMLRSSAANVRIDNQDLGPIRRTYGEVDPGNPLALIGSEGMLELAVAHGHGGDTLDVKIGDTISVLID